MAYTESDLQAIKAAIVELASGQRVTKFEHGGRKVEYAAADINKLRGLQKEIQKSLLLEARKRRSRTRIVTTSKGLW